MQKTRYQIQLISHRDGLSADGAQLSAQHNQGYRLIGSSFHPFDRPPHRFRGAAIVALDCRRRHAHAIEPTNSIQGLTAGTFAVLAWAWPPKWRRPAHYQIFHGAF